MSYQLAGERVRPKVFYYAYAPSTHSHTGNDRLLKHSCHLGHSPFSEAKMPKRVEEFFGFSKFWIFVPFSSFWRPLKIFTGGGAWTPLPARHWCTKSYTFHKHRLFSIVRLVLERIQRKHLILKQSSWVCYTLLINSASFSLLISNFSPLNTVENIQKLKTMNKIWKNERVNLALLVENGVFWYSLKEWFDLGHWGKVDEC